MAIPLRALILAALALLLSSCSLVESVAHTTKSVCGIHDPAPPRSMSAMSGIPENEWEATWKGERDQTLRELRFGGKEAQ